MGRRRRKRGLLDIMAALPWPVCVAFGLIGYPVIRYGLSAWLNNAGPLAGAFSPLAGVLALLWLGASLMAVVVAGIEGAKRRRLLDTRTSLESLSATGWRNFERLVGEAFRRQGYAVEENHHGGPDGGIDLVLSKDGRCILVQCKQWRREQVGVAIVREMYGLLVHHRADAARIVTTGTYTEAAAAFAAGKPIELVTGEQLLAMIRAVQPNASTMLAPLPLQEPVHTPTAEAAPACPRCGAAMVERRNRRTGASFMGCSRFPACRGTT